MTTTIPGIFPDEARERERQTRVTELLSRQSDGTILQPPDGWVRGTNTPFYAEGEEAQAARLAKIAPVNGIIDPDGLIGDPAHVQVSAQPEGPTPWRAPIVEGPVATHDEVAAAIREHAPPILVPTSEIINGEEGSTAVAPVIVDEDTGEHYVHISLFRKAWNFTGDELKALETFLRGLI